MEGRGQRRATVKGGGGVRARAKACVWGWGVGLGEHAEVNGVVVGDEGTCRWVVRVPGVGCQSIRIDGLRHQFVPKSLQWFNTPRLPRVKHGRIGTVDAVGTFPGAALRARSPRDSIRSNRSITIRFDSIRPISPRFL
jgi:hypothetical protein